jgi:hypothetical protein
MECGSQEFLCELTNWLSENEMVGPWLVEVIGRFGAQAQGIAGSIAQFVRDYGQSIVGLIGVSFGFWRWWRYREHILHKRLAEYLRENDTRLATGTADLIELIQRPAPGQQFKDPLFIDDDLRVVLRERNWDKPAYAVGVAASSDWQLERAIGRINRRLSTAHATVASLNRQLFSALSIRGAIAGASPRSKDTRRLSDALGYFKAALAVPGHGRDITVCELEAHQMRKLGLGGRDVYNNALNLATTIEDARERCLQLARLKRYTAEVIVGTTPQNAYYLLTDPEEALPLMTKCEPLGLWERLEKADTQYLAGYCAKMSNFNRRERVHLSEAETSYSGLVRELSARRWLRPRQYRRLRSIARGGLARVENAKNGTYDTSWLP